MHRTILFIKVINKIIACKNKFRQAKVNCYEEYIHRNLPMLMQLYDEISKGMVEINEDISFKVINTKE